jgi:hypothetical protein
MRKPPVPPPPPPPPYAYGYSTRNRGMPAGPPPPGPPPQPPFMAPSPHTHTHTAVQRSHPVPHPHAGGSRVFVTVAEQPSSQRRPTGSHEMKPSLVKSTGKGITVKSTMGSFSLDSKVPKVPAPAWKDTKKVPTLGQVRAGVESSGLSRV